MKYMFGYWIYDFIKRYIKKDKKRTINSSYFFSVKPKVGFGLSKSG